MSANLCYLLACLTLNQCNSWLRHAKELLPNTRIESFYWLNPSELPINPELQHSLYDITEESRDALAHWTFANPSSMHWLPYYHLQRNRSYYDSACTAYVKLDSDVLLAQPSFDYVALFQKLYADAQRSSNKLVSFEASCDAGARFEAGNLLLDLDAGMAVLNKFQIKSIAEATQFYISGSLDDYVQTTQLTFPSAALDLSLCLDTQHTRHELTLVKTEQPFMRLLPNVQSLHAALEVHEEPTNAAPSHRVFF